MCGSPCHGTPEFWRRVEEAHGGAIAMGVVAAARAHVEYSRAMAAKGRAEALLGSGAGREYEHRAEMYHAARTSQLRAVRVALPQLFDRMDAGQRKHVDEFLGDGLKGLVSHARHRAVEALLHSELTPNDAREGIQRLDDALSAIAKLTTLKDLSTYLNQRLDELIAKKMGNTDGLQGLCILLLILTSIFVVLVIIAALICALTFGTGCDGILDQLVNQACPP